MIQSKLQHDSLPNSLRNNHSSILITGGLGGLGIVTAEALVELGATSIVLASRSGKIKYDGQGLQERLDALRASGATIVIEQCDTADEQQVIELLERVRCGGYGPLGGVVHAAGVLSDSMLRSQNEESIRRVVEPKAMGAWYLHKHTTDDALDIFMTYSSVASLFGNVGQANYSAANAFLDELVRWRVSQGLCGVSVQWPAVSGVGMAASMDERVGISDSISIDVRMVKQVVQQLVSSSRLDGDPVQAVLPRGMLEVGAMPKQHFGSLLSSVKVRSVSTGKGSSRSRGSQAKSKHSQRSNRQPQHQSSVFQGMNADEMETFIRNETTRLVMELLGVQRSE